MKTLRFSFKHLEIHLLSSKRHFAGDQAKIVRSEPSSATWETQNVN